MFCAGRRIPRHAARATTTLITRTTRSITSIGTCLQTNHDVFRFFQLMIAFRKAHPSIARSQYWREDVRWFGRTGSEVDLSPEGQTLAYCLHGARLNDDDIYVMVNAGANETWFHVQEGKAAEWLLIVDTSLPSPLDIASPVKSGPRISRLSGQGKKRGGVVPGSGSRGGFPTLRGFSRVSVDLFANNSFGGFVQPAVERLLKLQILGPECFVDKRSRSPDHHCRVPLAVVPVGLQAVPATERRE